MGTGRETLTKDGLMDEGEINAHIGHRLRRLRMLAGQTQTSLADAMGIVFQQVQKYENGRNRITAAKLYMATSFLELPITDFYAGLPGVEAGEALPDLTRQTSRLLQAFVRIGSDDIQRQCLALIEFLAVQGK